MLEELLFDDVESSGGDVLDARPIQMAGCRLLIRGSKNDPKS